LLHILNYNGAYTLVCVAVFFKSWANVKPFITKRVARWCRSYNASNIPIISLFVNDGCHN